MTTVVRLDGQNPKVTVSGGAARRVTLDARTAAVVADKRPAIITNPQSSPVDVTQRPTTVHTGNAMGVQGPPGETEGATKNLVAGETIFGHRVVRVNGSAIYHPNISIDTHADQVVGIATQSGSTGNLVSVRTKGTLTEPSWTWAPGFVWCGSSGALTQSPSATGWLMVVGRVLSPTSIDVDIEPAIHRIGATAPDYFPAEDGPSYFPGGW